LETTITGRLRPSSTSNQFLLELMGPYAALKRSRMALMPNMKKLLSEAVEKYRYTIGSAGGGTAPQLMFVFSLHPAPVPLPLGWMLSKRAAESIGQEMHGEPEN